MNFYLVISFSFLIFNSILISCLDQGGIDSTSSIKRKIKSLQSEISDAVTKQNFTYAAQLKLELDILEEQFKKSLNNNFSMREPVDLFLRSFDLWNNKVIKFTEKRSKMFESSVDCIYSILNYFGNKGIRTIAFRPVSDRNTLHNKAYEQYYTNPYIQPVNNHGAPRHRIIQTINDLPSNQVPTNIVNELEIYIDSSLDPRFHTKTIGIGPLYKQWLEYFYTNRPADTNVLYTYYTEDNTEHVNEYIEELLHLQDILDIDSIHYISRILYTFTSPLPSPSLHILLYKLANLTGFQISQSKEWPLIVTIWDSTLIDPTIGSMILESEDEYIAVDAKDYLDSYDIHILGDISIIYPFDFNRADDEDVEEEEDSAYDMYGRNMYDSAGAAS